MKDAVVLDYMEGELSLLRREELLSRISKDKNLRDLVEEYELLKDALKKFDETEEILDKIDLEALHDEIMANILEEKPPVKNKLAETLKRLPKNIEFFQNLNWNKKIKKKQKQARI